MLSILTLFLGGMAVATTLLPDENSEYEDKDQDDEFVKEPFEIVDIGDLYLTNGDEEVVVTKPSEAIESPSAEHTNSSESEIPVTPSNIIQENQPTIVTEVDESIELSIQDILTAPSALSDWSNNENVPVITLGKDDTLSISSPTEMRGSFVVLDADYIEHGDNANGETTIEHTGSNVYFVPDGENFPRNYEWSFEGATLVDTSDYANEVSDFGGIKLVARIDSGCLTSEYGTDNDVISLHDDRIGDPQVLSSSVLSYI